MNEKIVSVYKKNFLQESSHFFIKIERSFLNGYLLNSSFVRYFFFV